LTVHVRPGVSGVEVLAAVDFDVDAPLLPVSIEIAPTTGRVATNDLACGHWQAVVLAQPAEVELCERVGSTGGISRCLQDQVSAARAAEPAQDRLDASQGDQPLLEAGGDQRSRLIIRASPLRRVDH
jgi:hypothetical protein